MLSEGDNASLTDSKEKKKNLGMSPKVGLKVPLQDVIIEFIVNTVHDIIQARNNPHLVLRTSDIFRVTLSVGYYRAHFLLYTEYWVHFRA